LQLFGFSLLSLPLLLNDTQILLGSFVEYRLGSLASFSDFRCGIIHWGIWFMSRSA
jgi:hypothetical protein